MSKQCGDGKQPSEAEESWEGLSPVPAVTLSDVIMEAFWVASLLK